MTTDASVSADGTLDFSQKTAENNAAAVHKHRIGVLVIFDPPTLIGLAGFASALALIVVGFFITGGSNISS